ncbi:MAG TPA: hypothetical protein PLM79_14660 [Syntrophobacteraceae bacterium]|nr:hypothetical protein [Syntrophobacteraceae bacterium]
MSLKTGSSANCVPFGLTMDDHSVAVSFFRYRLRKRKPPRKLPLFPLVLFLGLVLPSFAGVNSEEELRKQVPPAHKVTITAYTNVPECTDSTPNETASLLQIRSRHYGKIIALSRDLAQHYRFGDKFQLWIDGKSQVVEYQDLMAARHANRIDLLLPNLRKCRGFGAKDGILVPLGKAGKRSNERTG